MDDLSATSRAGRIFLIGTAVLAILWIAWALRWSLQGFIDEFGLLSSLEIASRLSGFVQISTGALYCLLGAVVISRSADRPGVMALGGFLIAQGLATGYLSSLYQVNYHSDWQLNLARLSVNLFAYVAAIRTAQLFPRQLGRADLAQLYSHSWRDGLWRLVSMFLTPWRVWLLVIVLLAAVPLARVELIFHLGQLLVIAIVVATMSASYRTGNADTQRKIYWLLAGACILLIARIISVTLYILLRWLGLTEVTVGSDGEPFYVAGAIRSAVWAAANVGLLSCVLAAVFYRGVVDPRMVIKRTAVYSTVLGILLFAFAVFVNFVSEILAEFLEITEIFIESVAGAAVAVAFKPLYDWLSRLAERVLPVRLAPGVINERDN